MIRFAVLLICCWWLVGCADVQAIETEVDGSVPTPEPTDGGVDGGHDPSSDPPEPDPQPDADPPPEPDADPPPEPEPDADPPPEPEPDADPPPEPEPDADPPPEPEPRCEPGSSVGLCAVCGADGVPEAPETDDACPPVDCGPALTYERGEDGGDAVCHAVRQSVPEVGVCLYYGICATADDLCAAPLREEAARLTEGPCVEMIGCVDDAPAEVIDRVGEPCNTFGECQAGGVCSAPPVCELFDPAVAVEYCRGGYDEGQAFCEFFADPPGEGSCTQVCATMDMVCLRAWGEDQNSCSRLDRVSCDRVSDDMICRCGAV